MELGIHSIPTGKWKENCYVVHAIADVERRALVIDPGGDAEAIADYITGTGLKPVAILNTHAHYDHIGAVAWIKRQFQVPFYLHSLDHRLLKQANLYRKIFDGDGTVEIPEVEFFFDQLPASWGIAPFGVSFLHTPGHTPGSGCIRVADALFSGDTLFRGAIGRTDLPGGHRETLRGSLRQALSWDPALRLFPGHGRPTTLEREIAENTEFREAVQ